MHWTILYLFFYFKVNTEFTVTAKRTDNMFYIFFHSFDWVVLHTHEHILRDYCTLSVSLYTLI